MSINYYLKRREEYIKQITDIANSNNGNKDKELQKLYNEYCMFCYRNNLQTFWNGFYDLFDKSYIIESEPLIFNVGENQVKSVIQKLFQVNYKNQDELVDGLTSDEAELILDWVVQNGRKNFSIYGTDIKTSSLKGCCGLAQAYTLIPLMDLGLEVTVNNARCFQPNNYGHAFGTVKIPIKENDGIVLKQFLVDISYRQFFSTVLSSEGEYFAYDKKLCNGSSPAAGYYITKTDLGKGFAKRLLYRGFIELTPENAKLYGHAFVCQTLNYETKDQEETFLLRSGEWYIDAINNNQVELDCSIEELENYNYNLDLPGFGSKR